MKVKGEENLAGTQKTWEKQRNGRPAEKFANAVTTSLSK